MVGSSPACGKWVCSPTVTDIFIEGCRSLCRLPLSVHTWPALSRSDSSDCSFWRREGFRDRAQHPPVSKRAYHRAEEGLFARTCSDRTRPDGFTLKESKFSLGVRKKFYLEEWWGAGCPEKLWQWKCSRPIWMGLWAIWSSAKCLCPWQGISNEITFKVPPKPNNCVSLISLLHSCLNALDTCICLSHPAPCSLLCQTPYA